MTAYQIIFSGCPCCQQPARFVNFCLEIPKCMKNGSMFAWMNWKRLLPTAINFFFLAENEPSITWIRINHKIISSIIFKILQCAVWKDPWSGLSSVLKAGIQSCYFVFQMRKHLDNRPLPLGSMTYDDHSFNTASFWLLFTLDNASVA